MVITRDRPSGNQNESFNLHLHHAYYTEYRKSKQTHSHSLTETNKDGILFMILIIGIHQRSSQIHSLGLASRRSYRR